MEQIKISTKSAAGEGPATDVANQDDMEISREDVEEPNRTSTRAELQAGQLTEAELLSLSILKVSRF